MRRRHLLRDILAFLWLATCISPAGAIGTTPPSWRPRETVASLSANYQDMEGADRSLAYDRVGNPGIAFFADVRLDLRYAHRVPDVGWADEAIDTSGNVGSFPSLAYDGDSQPAVSYFDFSNGHLKFARLDGGSWQMETADTTSGVGWYTSLAFDRLGRAAIAYQDIANTSLKYVQDTDGDFSFLDETPVTVVNEFSEGHYASLVFDVLNRPMIAHFDNTNFNLRFSVQKPDIGWVTTTVDSTNNTGLYPSIAIDPESGFPAIAYYDDTNDDLRYAAWDGEVWSRTTLDATGSIGLWPSLVFDPADGNPAIAYFDDANDDLKLAWHDGSVWQIQTVDAVGNVGRSPSLAFSANGGGLPAIAYFDGGIGGNGSMYFIDVPPLLGDYNADDVVDGADYTVWRDHLDEPSFDLPNEGATEGMVSDEDFAVWRMHFGETADSGAGGSASALIFVPELSAVVLGWIALICGWARQPTKPMTTSPAI